MSESIKTIGYWLTKWSQLEPGKPALVEGNNELSYREFNSRVNRLANSLRDNFNVKKGDRIGILLSNRMEFMEDWFAASKLGAILTPFNFRLAEEELEYLFEDASPQILFYEQAFEEKVKSVDPSSTGIEHVVEITDEKTDEYVKTVNSGKKEEPGARVKMDDPCIIPYTGGTTGLPKGAVLTHKNITYHTLSMIKNYVDITSRDTTLTILPLFHTGGFDIFSTPTIYQGARLVLQRTFDPEEVLKNIEKYGVNLMFGVPTIYKQIAESPKFEETDFSSLRALTCGGDYCPPEIIKKYQDRGIKFVHGYGLTESGPGVLSNVYTDEKAEEKSRGGSVGKPFFYSEVKIVDDDGNEVSQGKTGELLTKGPHVMKEYWNKPGETKEAFKGEWLKTGDLAREDEDGYYYIEGRKKGMIVSGGENIYLSEVERALASHPDIAEVAVIGVPDEKWGQVGKAIIVPEGKKELPRERLIEYCGGRLAKYKIPKFFEFTDSLPVGPAGSIEKEKLRQKYG
ncbi:long-chain fatty acid--CoA ligase [Candidatus Bipolaricaulota bacterium]|nr:long-chain fatty acid--CoA ligase [Candidatus Bipolaricaulota bacterium]MBS3792606.1 long-chain fatty acid--CoA ligase [Candidatus Bipolaricaulota bacterium]